MISWKKQVYIENNQWFLFIYCFVDKIVSKISQLLDTNSIAAEFCAKPKNGPNNSSTAFPGWRTKYRANCETNRSIPSAYVSSK